MASTCCSSTTAAVRLPVVDVARWTSGRRRRSTRTSQCMRDFADRAGGDAASSWTRQALSPGGHVRPVRRRGPAAGHRRPVRGDQGPDRRLDDHRRRVLRAGARAGRRALRRARARAASRSTSGSRSGRSTAPSRPPISRVSDRGRALLRELTPAVIGVLVRRGADFATAEDAVQDALLRALATWPDDPPRGPEGLAGHGRLAQVPGRDPVRDAPGAPARYAVAAEPAPGPAEDADDTLQLYFLCAHPSLTPASAVALTLRAVGGLTTRQIAEAYLVPEATMAQRISRAKRTVVGRALRPARRPGHRAAGALPGLQRGLHRRGRPRRRGDPADPPAARR